MAATENVFDFSRLRGQTFTVTDPAATMDAALQLLGEEGFTELDAAAANARLVADGSPWRLRVAIIGNNRRAWWFSFFNDVLPFLTLFRRAIPRTYVVATDGRLVGVAPIVSWGSDPDSDNAAAPRVNRVLQRLGNWPGGPVTGVGDRFWIYPGVTSPLYPKLFRKLTGLR